MTHRPAETVAERLEWVLDDAQIARRVRLIRPLPATLSDLRLDACDYDYPLGALEDCALVGDFNYWLEW